MFLQPTRQWVFSLSARGPTRRRKFTGLAELRGGWPIETSVWLILPYNHPLNGARYHTQWLDHRWNWITKTFAKKIHWDLFSVILSILAPFVALFTVFYLFSPPDTLLSSYYCQLFCIDVVAIHVLSICHQDMWKKPLGLSCLLDLRYFSTHFQ